QHRYLRGRIQEAEGGPSRAAEAYQKASDLGSEEATRRLAEMYESGTGVTKDTTRAAKLRAELPDKAMKRFTVPCQLAGYDKPFPLHIYITGVPDGVDDPTADEARRLKEDHNATLPPDVVDS